MQSSQHAGENPCLLHRLPLKRLICISHIFCADCSRSCQLSDQHEGQGRRCPACDMNLTNPDDVVLTNLNPTEDYKTSVLSGLNPNVIMECAGRALSFWAYQTTQEMFVQKLIFQRRC